MSQLKITNAGIDYRNAVFSGEEVQNITHFVFANMPEQDASAPIDPNTTIPTDVLHYQPIKAVSKVDGNAVVISAVLGYNVGDFEYNWYGVVATKQNGEQVLIAVVTTELQTKTKTVGAVTGNYSVKSIVWRSQNIADDLNITLAVLPWQVQDEELVSKAVFEAHNHDDNYVKKEQVLTNVPENAIFIDTWREVINNLTSTNVDKSLSAAQGRQLKLMIDNIKTLLASDDTTLDEVQEIVNFIKINKSTLDSLSISSIAGLQTSLNEIYNKAIEAIELADSKLGRNEAAPNSDGLAFKDVRSSNDAPNKIHAHKLTAHFKQSNAVGSPPVTSTAIEYSHILNVCGWEAAAGSGGLPTQLSIGMQGIAYRTATSTSNWGGWQTFWHTGNMGTGSGLDADKLDGLQAEQFLRADRTDTMKGNLKIDVNASYYDLASNAPSNVGQFKIESGNNAVSFGLDEVTNSRKAWIQVGHNSNAYPSEQVQGKLALNPIGGDVEINGKKAWHAGNMGAGSGLDADKLDGHDGDYFAKEEDLQSLSESRKFTRSNKIANFRRHSLGEGNYTVPSVRVDGSELQDQDWFSVRSVTGEPVLKIEDGAPAKFKRLLDDEIDTQVKIVAEDKTERVFVFNKTDNLWEF